MRDNIEKPADNARVDQLEETPVVEAGLVAFSALAVETVLWRFASAAERGLLIGGVAHLVVILLLAGWLRRLVSKGRDLRIPLLLCSTTAVLGPLGPAGVLLTSVFRWWFARSAMTFESWYASLFPEDTREHEPVPGRHLTGDSLESTNVVPFMDVLSFGTRQQKQSMIALITSRFQPAFAPVLRRALNDGNNAIRVQAATAITMVENNFLERSMALAEDAGNHPRSAEAILELAHHYDAYAFAGILDEKRERDNREKAISAYRDYLALRPEDEAVRAELGRILVRRGDFAQAIELLQGAIEEGHSSPRAVLWCMESLYNLGRYEEMCRMAGAYVGIFGKSEALPVEAGETLRLWASRNAISAVEAPVP